MRTLFYEFPDDNCWDIYDEYMFEMKFLLLLYAMSTKPDEKFICRKVTSWTSAHNGEVYEGGKTYNIDAPIDTIPVFLKDGSNKYLIGEI